MIQYLTARYATPLIIDVGAVEKRATVFGNRDAAGVLQDGSEDLLRAEIDRLLRAGRKNGNRFIMSTGSPIKPGTPVPGVRRYTDIIREVATYNGGSPTF